MRNHQNSLNKMSIKYIFLALIAFCIMACEKDKSCYSEKCACGVENPKNNIEWLAELIKKAETDKSGNYLGSIWLEKYNGNDIFVIDMALGSGGIAYYFYDCKGNSFIPESEFVVKKEILIYTNLY